MRAAAIVLWLACTEAWARQRQGNRKLVLRRSGGEESLAAGVARAAALVDAKQLDEAEALLLELRATPRAWQSKACAAPSSRSSRTWRA